MLFAVCLRAFESHLQEPRTPSALAGQAFEIGRVDSRIPYACAERIKVEGAAGTFADPSMADEGDEGVIEIGMAYS
jgi:hypothetical protein